VNAAAIVGSHRKGGIVDTVDNGALRAAWHGQQP